MAVIELNMSTAKPGGTVPRVPPSPAPASKASGAPAKVKGVKGGVTKSLAGGKGVSRAAASAAAAALAASAVAGEGEPCLVLFVARGFGLTYRMIPECIGVQKHEGCGCMPTRLRPLPETLPCASSHVAGEAVALLGATCHCQCGMAVCVLDAISHSKWFEWVHELQMVLWTLELHTGACSMPTVSLRQHSDIHQEAVAKPCAALSDWNQRLH